MINIPAILYGNHRALYDYLKNLTGRPSGNRPNKIHNYIDEARTAGAVPREVNPHEWASDDAHILDEPFGPKHMSMHLPHPDTFDAVEADDGLGSSAGYALPDFYKGLFMVDGAGAIVQRPMNLAERQEVRKQRLAEYVTGKCF